ncbi:MAG: [protein-PII] uridylyltransferase, partial [Acidimicrobiales bacterium]
MANPVTPSLRERRLRLIDDRSRTGTAWCRAFSAACDGWLREVLDQAMGRDSEGVALLAVGGYGCGELAPGSDLDLLLVHDRKGRIGPVADALWYPIWDEGIELDHSVRTLKELRNAMNDDLRVALGALQARPVAGDERLGREAVSRALDLWRSRTDRWLPQVAGAVGDRHERFGDLAFLLEPDLKEARGGVRDLRVLQAVAQVSPVVAGVVADPDLGRAADLMSAARVELQRATGKSANRLLLQDQDVVAEALRYPDADQLMLAVAGAARTIAWAGDDGWRRVGSWLRGPRGRESSGDRPLEPGLVLRDGEVTLAGTADPGGDPSLALRAAAASAELDRPLARGSLDRLADETRAPDAVWPDGIWPDEMRRALVRILAAGRPAIAAIEALDQRGIWVTVLPEWEAVRNRPQRNAYHRFTVDRHLLEAAANASELVRRVERPDLLLLGALLHDIGKGRGGDHTEAGIGIVDGLAPRMGLGPPDTEALRTLVRLHLLLPDAATRRDLDDPVTIETVAEAVGDRTTLHLLAALTEADSLATGPSAWGTWKADLVARLVQRVSDHLVGQPVPPAPALTPAEEELAAGGRLAVVAEGSHVTVAAPDRSGLLSVVAGVLAVNGVTVRSAHTRTEPGGGARMAVLAFDVTPTLDVLPDWAGVE